MTELKQGDTVFFVTGSGKLKELKFHSDGSNGYIWVVYPEDWELATAGEIESEGLYFSCSPHSWRATRREALELLQQRLMQRRQQLAVEIEEMTDQIANIIEELYP